MKDGGKDRLDAILQELQGVRSGINEIVALLKLVTGQSAKIISDDESAFGIDGEDDEDELYAAAKNIVLSAGKASTSYLQRKLGIGYARAAKLMDMLEDKGVVGPAFGASPRHVIKIITPEVLDTLTKIEEQLKKKDKK